MDFTNEYSEEDQRVADEKLLELLGGDQKKFDEIRFGIKEPTQIVVKEWHSEGAEKIRQIIAEHKFTIEVEKVADQFVKQYNIPKHIAIMLLVTGARIGSEFVANSEGVDIEPTDEERRREEKILLEKHGEPGESYKDMITRLATNDLQKYRRG